MRKLRHQVKQEFPNQWLPTGQLSGSQLWLHVRIPWELLQILMLGPHSRPIILDYGGRGQALVFVKAPRWLQQGLGGLADPGGGMLRLEVQGLSSVVGEVLAWEFHHYQHSLLPSFTALGMKTLLYQRLKTPGEWSIANPRAIQSGLVITPRKRLNSPLFPAHFWSLLSLPPFLPRMPTPPGAVFIQAGLEMPTLLWIVPHFQERRLSPLLLILHDSATLSIHLLFAVRSYPGFYTCAKQVTQGFS